MTFRSVLIATATAALIGGSALAGEFSEGSQAKEWGLLGEETAMFSGKVVDLLCEISGDCADNCGNGSRQLGILRSADNTLVPAFKNRQAAFNGAIIDLLPYCNKMVDVDGVLVGDPDQTPVKMYMVQFIREEGAAEWNKTSLWTKQWNADNPEKKGVKGPWFRKDDRVLKQIEKHGYLGLGPDEDKKFIEEWY